MIKPDYLKKGDKVAIVSPAGKIEKNIIDNAVATFSNWGLDIIVGKYACNKFHQFAGTDKERMEDLQKMIDDENIKAIFSSRGGYGSIRIIKNINFKKLIKYPKWIVGFSDITVFHSHLNSNLGIETIHGVMPKNFPVFSNENESVKSLQYLLFGNCNNYEIESNKLNISGKTEGILTGGNLSVLHGINGTKYDFDPKGKILFIEDLNEYLYHIDRIMISLKYNGKLERIKGLIVGDFTDMKDNKTAFGKNIYEIILEHTKEFLFPVCFGFPAGHTQKNIALKFGSKVELTVGGKCNLKYL